VTVSILQLGGGRLVHVRHVRPSDRQLLRRGFEQLSPRSRYQRFLSARDSLSEEELRYLTDIDGWDHVAFAAIAIDAAEAELVAIARFIRYTPAGVVAEPALAVIDAYQGLGLGRRLVEQLTDAARVRGVLRFRFETLASNAAVLALAAYLPGVAMTTADGVVTVEAELGSALARPACTEVAARRRAAQ